MNPTTGMDLSSASTGGAAVYRHQRATCGRVYIAPGGVTRLRIPDARHLLDWLGRVAGYFNDGAALVRALSITGLTTPGRHHLTAEGAPALAGKMSLPEREGDAPQMIRSGAKST